MAAALRYMGSKRSLAPRIASLIHEKHANAHVVDAFAGTCAVGTALAPCHRVIANDVHLFAHVIATALLVAPRPKLDRSVAVAELHADFCSNLDLLSMALEDRIQDEKRALARLAHSDGWRSLRKLTASELARPVPLPLAGLPSWDSYRADNSLQPHALFSMLYASTYFGVAQCAEIDSLSFAISRSRRRRRGFYMLALLQAVSHASAATGHFAQFLVPRDEANTRWIGRVRKRSIWDLFLQELNRIEIPECLDRGANEAHRSDAVAFLRERVSTHRDSHLVIYADPPYSRAQYSRYYHVLETLVRYDYPQVSGKARYREDRFSTDFSRKRGVVAAMDSFVKAACETGAPLYLSYPRNGLLYSAKSDPLDILKQHYRRARSVLCFTLAHSTLGAAPGFPSQEVEEDVFYASL